MTSTTYRVGDPDPTEDDDRTDEDCPALTGSGTYEDPAFWCIWPIRHEGAHVAAEDGLIVAVWE